LKAPSYQKPYHFNHTPKTIMPLTIDTTKSMRSGVGHPYIELIITKQSNAKWDKGSFIYWSNRSIDLRSSLKALTSGFILPNSPALAKTRDYAFRSLANTRP
jgi:hypothetical protein